MKESANPHWIRHSHLLRSDEYECSVCRATFKRRSRTCPKCGAVLIRVADRQEWIDEAAMLDEILGDD